MVNSLVKSLKRRIKFKPTRQNKKCRLQMPSKAWPRLFSPPSCISIVVFSPHSSAKCLILEEDYLFGWIVLFIHTIVSSKVYRERDKRVTRETDQCVCVSGTNGCIKVGILNNACLIWRDTGPISLDLVSNSKMRGFVWTCTKMTGMRVGFPGTLLTFFLSFLRSGAVFALIYPTVSTPDTLYTLCTMTKPRVSHIVYHYGHDGHS